MVSYLVNQKSEIGVNTFNEESSLKVITADNRLSYLLDKYGKYDKRFNQVLETMTDDDFIFHGGFTQIVMPVGYKERMCLIGDASYCATLYPVWRNDGNGRRMYFGKKVIGVERLRKGI